MFAALTASALLMLLSLTVLASNAPAHQPLDRRGNVIISPSATNNFDQLVVVLMENKNLNEVYGPAPYMTQLADQYSFSQGWSSITNPSQPNYIALLGASTFGVGGDGNHPNLNHPTLVDLIETSGHTWNAIAEGSGSGCSINPDRGEDHFPFLSYTTITGNPARCANLHSGGPADVVTALNAGTSFIWFTPNDSHNMHDNSVASGDAWIQSWVPGLLTAMGTKKAALILMFDEAYTSPPYIYMSFSGPATKLAYKSTASYSHYSLAKLLEDVWGGGSLAQGDVNAPSPLEFFGAGGPPVPDFSIAANPGSVSFIAGQSATSTVSLTASGGFTGTVGLAAVSVPVGATTSCVPASISGTQTSTCTFTGTNAGSYAVTITGTSGTLVHTAPVAVTITAPGPTARYVYSPTVPSVNDTITYDASTSTDSDPSATLQARWDWESDGTWDTTLSSSLTAQHAFAKSGSYTVKLEIQDSHGFSDTDSRVVTVFASGGGGVGAPPGYGLTNPSLLQAHGPIYIGSDAQFTAANGVRSGTGTTTDPYVISNWFIDGNLYAGTQAMLWIEGTSSYVVIENVRIANLAGTNQWEAFQLGHWPATVSTQHVTIRHNSVENAQHAYGIAVREGSSDVHVEANYVQLEANVDWVYGIATDRGVHDITIFGNYVNAHTSGIWHTVGIHLSDYHVTDARRATGMVAMRNTVVNATAGGIISESSVGTIVGWNLVYMDYPGSKSVAVDYPRGIETEWFSNGTLVVGNVIHTFHWGIQVGSDLGVIASNTISDVDYAIYVLDNAAWPGISTAAETIYDTTYSTVVITPIRLPTGFQGTVVDLGPGITKTDLTPVTFVTSPAATSATFAWSGSSLNLSATVGGLIVFDTANTAASQNLQASWTGSLANLDVTSLSAAGVSFLLQSAAAVVFDGSGFTPTTTYNVTRTNTGGTSRILSAQSTPVGALTFTIPTSTPSTYTVSPGSTSDITPPVTTYSASGSSGANSWYTSSVTVTLTATDDSSGIAAIHFRTDGGAWQSYASPFTVQSDGSHAIDYYSTDSSGNNEALRAVTVKVDSTAPSSSVALAGTQAADGSYISS
ncbi:MAG TPA: alkaline phosphatase family protein, partial [Thermoplasmata archaeon]